MTFPVANQDVLQTQMDQLRNGNANVRRQAVASLGVLGRAAPAAITALADALHDFDSQVRKEAALALGRTGPRAKADVPALLSALVDESEVVRRAAAEVLGRPVAPAGNWRVHPG